MIGDLKGVRSTCGVSVDVEQCERLDASLRVVGTAICNEIVGVVKEVKMRSGDRTEMCC